MPDPADRPPASGEPSTEVSMSLCHCGKNHYAEAGAAPPALDVERLKRVILASGRFIGGEIAAEDIATEYARLSASGERP